MAKRWIFVFWAAAAAMAASAVSAGTLTGTAGYRERIALPPEAVLEVRLEDVSRADAPSRTLAMKQYALSGVPMDFTLEYDDALIRDALSYVLRATISMNDRLLFTTDTAHPVLTRGAGSHVDITLVKVPSPAPTAGFAGTAWQVVELDGMSIATEKVPELRFDDEGHFAAYAGCNRFRGGVEVGDGTIRFSQNAAATLMACATPYDVAERRYVDALMRAQGFTVVSDMLELTDGAGSVLMRLRPLR
jgi:putative lipoprotein